MASMSSHAICDRGVERSVASALRHARSLAPESWWCVTRSWSSFSPSSSASRSSLSRAPSDSESESGELLVADMLGLAVVAVVVVFGHVLTS